MLGVLRWEPSGKGEVRQLIVLCHGVGADASQMSVFVDAWAARLPEAAFLAPDGPDPFDQYLEGYQWFSLQDRTPAVLEAGARRAAPLLDARVDAELDRLGVPDAALALVGFSQGAMMVLHAGLRRRVAPGAILAYSGALLATPGLAGELSGRPPVLLVHGESDGVVPFARGLQAATALQTLGVPVETCWRPDLGHSVDDAGLLAGAAFLRRTVGEGAAGGGVTNT